MSRAERTACLNSHFESLLFRIHGSERAIRDFVASAPDNAAWISVVRYFEPGPEDDGVLARRDADVPDNLEVMRGQHPLLGFTLEQELSTFLGEAGIAIDFDEYGDEYE